MVGSFRQFPVIPTHSIHTLINYSYWIWARPSDFKKKKTFYFILEYSRLTMWWQFQVDSKGTQLYMYTSLPHRASWATPRALLVIHFKHSNAGTTHVDYCSSAVSFEIRKCETSKLCSSSSRLSWPRTSLVVQWLRTRCAVKRTWVHPWPGN